MILKLSESKQKKVKEIVCIECLIQENNEQKQIVLEQYIDREEETDKSTEIIKQRRRGARL